MKIIMHVFYLNVFYHQIILYPKQSQLAIWHEFLKFESQVGDLQSIKKVEKRRLAYLFGFT